MNEDDLRLGLAEILLVEDNPDDEQLTIEALKEARLVNRLQVVRDGAEALEFLFSGAGERAADLKVVLLDIKLPKIDGLEVLRRIRANPGSANLPVVILTSSAEERDLQRGYDLKANSYIVKPVDFIQFANAVKEIGAYWALLNRPPVLPVARTEKAPTTIP
jgi:two-component system response regulator